MNRRTLLQTLAGAVAGLVARIVPGAGASKEIGSVGVAMNADSGGFEDGLKAAQDMTARLEVRYEDKRKDRGVPYRHFIYKDCTVTVLRGDKVIRQWHMTETQLRQKLNPHHYLSELYRDGMLTPNEMRQVCDLSRFKEPS